MKKVLIVISVIAVVFAIGMANPKKAALSKEQTEAIQKAVLASHREMIKAMKKLDVEKFYDYIIESGEGTIVQEGFWATRKKSLERTKKNLEGVKQINYEFSKEIVNVLSPETAIFIGRGKNTVTQDTGEVAYIDFAVTSVFVLKDGTWKMVHGHYSIPNSQ
jgi:hypothetical protein